MKECDLLSLISGVIVVVLDVVQIIFIALDLTHSVQWAWYFVISPLIIETVFLVILAVFVIIYEASERARTKQQQYIKSNISKED